mmetsp:Transcript_41324/g.128439  ORF Transcript_41324/g.128439 Transcript_41324/m.128439 type:complete len:251 (-) Transcript_41324:242-994(-)
MKDSTNGLPIVASRVQPEIPAAFWFHSVTFPFLSMPKIGALAVSMTRVRSSAMRVDWVMASRYFVMSWPTTTTPLTWPSALRRGVAFNKTSICDWSFVRRGNSKLAVSWPSKAWFRTSWTFTLKSSVMNSSTRGLPMVSSFGKPEISAAFRFHSVTLPSLSTPKIGAFADSMSRDRSSAMECCSEVILRSSVMSCPTPMTPTISPLALRRVVALSRISRLFPDRLNSGNSKLEVSFPCKASVNTRFTSGL